MRTKVNEIQFSDHDVVNPDDYQAWRGGRVWVFHDHGFVLGVVIQATLQDALDELADSGKIDHLQLGEDQVDWSEEEQEERGPDGQAVTRLGNAGEPFDGESIDVVELPEPEFSLVALLEEAERNGRHE